METIVKVKTDPKIRNGINCIHNITFEFSYNNEKHIFWFFVDICGNLLNDIEPYDEKGFLGGKEHILLYDGLPDWVKWYLEDTFISKEDINNICENIMIKFNDFLKENDIKIRKFDGHDE